jgi:hypothetical protein
MLGEVHFGAKTATLNKPKPGLIGVGPKRDTTLFDLRSRETSSYDAAHSSHTLMTRGWQGPASNTPIADECC